ncbi:MAG: hypothetical protein K5768_03410 [Firmicutes bacterium]|nr:hypothetical protein [Bacillota bacterium]
MKYAFKCFWSLSIIIAILICSIPVICAEEVTLQRSDNVAEAYLTDSLLQSNFAKIECVGAKEQIGYKGQKSCWILDPKAAHTINFSFSDNFKPIKEFDGSTYDFEIEYYDEYEGFFQLDYDRKGRNEIEFDRIAFMTKDRTWKTLNVTLDDAVFNRNLDGFDFCITLKATLPPSYYTDANNVNSVAIRHIKVTKHEGVNPIYATARSEKGGNSYAWFWKNKEVINAFENVSDQTQSIKVISKMVSEKQRVPFIQNDFIVIEPGEIKELTVDAGKVTECGIYDWIIEIIKDDVTISEFSPIKIAIMKADPDGIRDENVFFSYQSELYNDEIVDNGFDVLSLTNSAGARTELMWRKMLNSNGDIDWNGTIEQKCIMKLKERGMKAYGLIWGTPANGLFQYKELPKSDEQIAAWREFARYVAKEISPYLSHVEIWNEPNLSSFCWNIKYETGKEYAKMAIATKQEFEQYAPSVKIAGPGITGISQGPEWTAQYENPTEIGGLHYIMQAMENDFHKYFNNVSVHAYSWGLPEASKNHQYLKNIKKLWTDAGEKEPEIWITEIGFTKTSDYVKTDYMQGALNVRQLLFLKENEAIDGEGLYCIYAFERKGYLDYRRESMFGIVNPVFSELPMYGTYAFPTEAALMISAMNYVMAKSDFVSAQTIDKKHIAKYKSRKWNKDIVTLYTENSVNEDITLDLGCNEVTVYDCCGNEEVVNGHNGIFTFDISDAPIYLIGDIPKLEVAENNALIKVNTKKIEVAKNSSNKITVENTGDIDCTIKVEVPPCAQTENSIELPSGIKRDIVINNIAPIGTNYTVHIVASDEYGILQTQNVEVQVVKPVVVDFECKLNDTKNINYWTGTLKIKNISDRTALKGQIKFKSPDFVKDRIIDIGIIPKGTTGLVKIPLPKMVRKGEYTFEYDINTNNGESYAFSQPFNMTIACYMDKKPTIDGVLSPDEWVYDSAMYADEFGQAQADRKDWYWNGPEDLSGRSGIGWDEENFYMFCEVTDNVFCQKSPVDRNWDGDGIQFGIVYNESAGVAIGQMGTTFHEIGVALSPEGPGVYRYSSQDNVYDPGEIKEADVAVRREGNKTYYELCIPWNVLLLSGQKPTSGENMGYSFLINEDDGDGRVGWIEYASGIGRSKNTSLFTILEFIK